MKKPPVHLDCFELRRPIHLVAFVEHRVLFPDHPTDEPFFLGIYCAPHRIGTNFYVVLVNQSGLKQRLYRPAGDSFEYALLVASGLFPITPTDVYDLQTVTDRPLFEGRLSREMARYRGMLRSVHKRLARLKMDYWKAAHARKR